MAFIIFLKRSISITIFVLLSAVHGVSQLPACKDSFPSSLLVNNSFEQYSGCHPTVDREGGVIDYHPNFGGITVPGWHSFQNNSNAFYHNYNCRSNRQYSIFDTVFTVFKGYPAVPLPLPDSSGFIAIFQQGKNPNSEKDINKGYITQCLSTPLLAGQRYTFSFYFGFGKDKSVGAATPVVSMNPYSIAIFGRQDCPLYPLPSLPDSAVGCLTNRPGWVQLASVELKGGYGWVQGVMEFTPSVNISAIGIGPDCSFNQNLKDTIAIHYMDKFVLAPKADFSFKTITAVSGSTCKGNLVIKGPDYPNAIYQWYKDGITITNASSNTYAVPNTISAAGNYSVNIGLSYNTCINTLPYAVTFSDLDKFSLGNDTTACNGTEVTLNATWQNADKYRWQDGSAIALFKVTSSGTYWVEVTDKNGCSKRDSVKVTLENCKDCKIYIPTAFTPNNDGTNDIFKALQNCNNISGLNFTMRIYNRWGQLIFKSNDINKGWDGTYKNRLLPNGVYIYSFNYSYKPNESIIKKGQIVLIK